MTKEIQLTRGFVALVDDDDFAWLSKWKWQATGREGEEYASRHEPGSGRVFMHKQILGIGKGVTGDHINRRPLDNRRSNLRIATLGENFRNRGYPRGATGFRGVVEIGGSYAANIITDGAASRAGPFRTPLQAAIAYDTMAKEQHGEFASLNFGADRDWLLIPPVLRARRGRRIGLRDTHECGWPPPLPGGRGPGDVGA